MAWLPVAIEALSLAYYSLLWILFTTAYLGATILHLVALPIRALWTVLLFFLAPVILTIRFFLSPLFIIVNSVPRLAPLYIFFASAITIGLLSGLLLTLTTSTTFSLLNLWDTNTTTTTTNNNNAVPSPPPPPTTRHRSRSTSPDTTTTSEQQQLEALLAGISSSPESDHLIAALTGVGSGLWQDPANTKRKRLSVRGGGGGGLGVLRRFGTILEEDDDSL